MIDYNSNLPIANQFKKMLTVSFIVAFCALFYLNFFVEGFIITLAVIVLPLLLYYNDDINAFQTCLAVAVVSPSFRFFTLILGGVAPEKGFQMTWPELFFYIVYGLVFYRLFSLSTRTIRHFIAAVFVSDLLSNSVEMSLRLMSPIIPISIFKGLVLVALTRTIIVIATSYGFIRVKRMLVHAETEKNYAELLILTSNFWSEIYFMQKNTTYIEALMAKAFNLYKYAEKHSDNQLIVEKSLDLAREVHEVKKDYLRVIKGLEAITEKKLSNLYMSIDQIVRLIVENSKKMLSNEEKATKIYADIKSKTKVYYHFYMTSVIQNLVSNAIEAVELQNDGVINLTVYNEDKSLIIIVKDNGVGIKERDIDYIFNPGYSSKYSEKSGDAKRGLGLNIVKNIVENEFSGIISVQSECAVGTTFRLEFPVDRLIGE
ncbi:MAG: hypothetical protein CSB19_00695 [Clostridiales bacterium]|nr:MAG: hypothetical protein CSB19_00695 [Clostridiales bacterium]